MKWLQVLELAVLPVLVNAVASTDEYSDADIFQSGYLPNHNIDPAVVPTWTRTWKNVYNKNEKFYADPLVYTPSGTTRELVIVSSNQNVVRVIDGLTGKLVANKTLDAPFASVDSNCNDVEGTVGITGTPVIDPSTDTMYFFAKGYFNGLAGPQGTLQGVYKLWALTIPTLAVVSGFPVEIGGPSDNDPTRYFVGGTVLQRPGLTTVGDSIIAGFGGHCDGFNFTGMLVAVSKTSATVTSVMAMEVSPGAPSPQATIYTEGSGGKGGIWQSGMGLSTDLANNRIIFSTGNGDGIGVNNGLNGKPASGKIPITTLGSTIVNFGVDPVAGKLTQQDYFQPLNYAKLNSGDKDISSSGVSLLDSTTFSGGGVNRVGISGSKAGIVYVVDADNLGGYRMGVNATDAVLQEITFKGSFYAGLGSYPLEGGYIYMCTTGQALQAWALTTDALGRPNFKFAAETNFTLGCHGTPTVTTLDGTPGKGVVWMSDSSKGLVAFHAVPVGGLLVEIPVTRTGGLMKYQRPVFGNNRAYVQSGANVIAVGGTPGPVTYS